MQEKAKRQGSRPGSSGFKSQKKFHQNYLRI